MPVHRFSLGFLVLGFVLVTFFFAPEAQAIWVTQLVRCAETSYTGTCGRDSLSQGMIMVNGSGRVWVLVKGALADPFTLYEVYWVPVGASITDAIVVGNFATDCNGNAVTLLREISAPIDVISGPIVSMHTVVGTTDAGFFAVYSRGIWGNDVSGDCKPDTFNTTTSPTDTDPTHPLANPPVDLTVDGVQFFSGYNH